MKTPAKAGVFIFCLNFELCLGFEVRDDVVDGRVADVRLVAGFATALIHAALTTLRFFDLEIDASVVLHTDNTKYGADSLGGRARAADDLAHVVLVDGKGEKYTHLIDNTINFYIVWMIDERLHYVIEKLLILFHIVLSKRYLLIGNSTLKTIYKIRHLVKENK